MIGIVDGIEINNYPEYADNEPYIVATLSSVDGKFWFFGAYNDIDLAKQVLVNIPNTVIFYR